ncbi:hypothetical protein HAX54_024769, partial [Datura stramonium]|nr:hypothetical protein [Datura stramonium]
MQEVLAVEPSFRNGLPSTYADRVFANEINIAVRTAEKNYNEYMFREALRTGFYDLQAARDEYRLSCGSGGMNRNMLWELLKKDGYVIKAGWPEADLPDLTLKK